MAAAAHAEVHIAGTIAPTLTRAVITPAITPRTTTAPWTPRLRCRERNRHGDGYGCGTQCFGEFIHIYHLKLICMEYIQQTCFPDLLQLSTEGNSTSRFSNQPMSVEIILIESAMFYLFDSAHRAKGYPRKIPEFRHSHREQNEQCRLDASRVGYAAWYMGMSYPGSSHRRIAVAKNAPLPFYECPFCNPVW
jgi:hypothetical protein